MSQPVTIYLRGTPPVEVHAEDASVSQAGGWYVWVNGQKRFYPMGVIQAVYFTPGQPNKKTA